MAEDAELLDRYAERRDEEAFAELVGRYIHVTFSMALRRMNGDVHLAQDVTQSVFTDLARKARALAQQLRRGQPLIGWLYTSTHFAASRIRRSETRRRQHELDAQRMEQILQPEGETREATWTEIRPFVDEILNRLGTTDRNAVLLRFFAGREVREVGAELGLSEDAARKRLDRSLDRLRDYLSRKGIRTGSAALAAALATLATETAPDGVAELIGTNALANAGVTGSASGWSGLQSLLTNYGKTFLAASAAVVVIGLLGNSIRRHFSATPMDLPPAGLASTPNLQPTLAAASSELIANRMVVPSGRSNHSETVRFPKSMLDRIPIFSLEMTNSEAREFVISPNAIGLLGITPSENAQVVSEISKTLDAYRQIEGKHLEPTDGGYYDPFPRSPDWRVIEHRTFNLVPFPEEALALQKNLEAEIDRVLGSERARLFLKTSYLFGGELKTFDQGTSGSTTYTYRLVTNVWGLWVDLHQASVGNGGGGGAGGGPYGAPLDRYAPESLRPVLAGWRYLVADYQTNKALKAIGQPQADESNRSANPPAEAGGFASGNEPITWDEGSTYIELPVSLLRSLKIAGLDENEHVSSEAVAICELTPLQENAVAGLYQSMKARFLELERKHFKRVEGTNKKFVIEAFPEEMETLRQQWNKKLKELTGEDRGEILDQLIRTPRDPRSGMEMQMRMNRMRTAPLPQWLGLGTVAVDAEILGDADPNGRFPGFEFRSRSGGDESGTHTPFEPQRVPERWRHLLTPEVLAAPAADPER